MVFGLFAHDTVVEGVDSVGTVAQILKLHHSKPLSWSRQNFPQILNWPAISTRYIGWVENVLPPPPTFLTRHLVLPRGITYPSILLKLNRYRRLPITIVSGFRMVGEKSRCALTKSPVTTWLPGTAAFPLHLTEHSELGDLRTAKECRMLTNITPDTIH